MENFQGFCGDQQYPVKIIQMSELCASVCTRAEATQRFLGPMRRH